jgi:hypothetical protein
MNLKGMRQTEKTREPFLSQSARIHKKRDLGANPKSLLLL